MMRTKQQPCRTLSDKPGNVSENPQAKSLKTLERVKGIEPSYSAWKAAALPLSYTRASDDLTRPVGLLQPPLKPPRIVIPGECASVGACNDKVGSQRGSVQAKVTASAGSGVSRLASPTMSAMTRVKRP